MAEKIVLGDPYLLNYMLEYTKIDIPFVVVIKYTESDGDDTIYGKGTKDNYKSEIIKTILDNQYEELIEDVFDKKITNTKQKLIDIVHKRFYFYEYWEAKAFVSGEWIDVDISLDEIVEIYISKITLILTVVVIIVAVIIVVVITAVVIIVVLMKVIS